MAQDTPLRLSIGTGNHKIQAIGNHHPQCIATKCGHPLHPSASMRTPQCPRCNLESANLQLEMAQAWYIHNGGANQPRQLRDTQWRNARLAYHIAYRKTERLRKKDQLRWERENTWDQLHLEPNSETVGLGRKCPVCVETVVHPDKPWQVPDNALAWWEREGATTHTQRAYTPLQPKKKYHQKFPHKPQGSLSMRKMIQECRNALVASGTEQQKSDIRSKTEAAIRRKHSIGEETVFNAKFWDSPLSGIATVRYHKELQVHKRQQERWARGNTFPPRPPRSSLSRCTSASEFEIDDRVKEEIKKNEEMEESERLERMAQKVGSEVGYLYFVGQVDGLEEWRGDYLNSDHDIVWRGRWQEEDDMDVD